MHLRPINIIFMIALLVMHFDPAYALKSVNDLYQTNDKELNKILLQIDSFGIKYPSDFSDVFAKISSEDRQVFLSYLKQKRYKPADISMSIGLGKVTSKSAKVILRQFSAHKGMGWSMIGTMHGLKAGSKRYAAWVESQKVHLFALESYRKKKIEAARPKKSVPAANGKEKTQKSVKDTTKDQAAENKSSQENHNNHKDVKAETKQNHSDKTSEMKTQVKEASKAVDKKDVKSVIKEEIK